MLNVQYFISYNVSYFLGISSLLNMQMLLYRNNHILSVYGYNCSKPIDAFQTKALINFPRYFPDSILLSSGTHQTAKEVHKKVCGSLLLREPTNYIGCGWGYVCVNMLYLLLFPNVNISLQPRQFPHNLMIIPCPLTFIHAVICFLFRDYEEVIYLSVFSQQLVSDGLSEWCNWKCLLCIRRTETDIQGSLRNVIVSFPQNWRGIRMDELFVPNPNLCLCSFFLTIVFLFTRFPKLDFLKNLLNHTYLCKHLVLLLISNVRELKLGDL